MSLKHLAKGSDCPPETPGLLRCYLMRFCPFSQRARLVLAAKGIKHEVVNINLAEKPDWLVEKNPLQKVPALELDGKLMFESLVICDYLDEAYPDNQLHQTDPWCKGEDRIHMEQFGKVSIPMYKIYGSYVKGEEEEVKKAAEDIKNGLDLFEKEIGNRGSKFFGGENPGMLDYMLWPWFERLPSVELMMEEKFPESRFPILNRWIEDMKEDEVVKSDHLSPEIHKEFLIGYFEGKPDFDMEIC